MIERTPCFYKSAPAGNWKSGNFLAWSTETFEHDGGQLFIEPVAIIEDEKTGNVLSFQVNWVRFQTPGF